MNLKSLLMGANKHNASDLHLLEGQPVFLRIHGSLKKVEQPPLTHEDMREIFDQIMPEHSHKVFEQNHGSDFSYQYESLNRYRCVAFQYQELLGMTMRVIPMVAPSLEDLQMPEVLKQVSLVHRGMVLLTGITGCGKSTTLAAMIHYLNERDPRRVVTIEDPIEYTFQPQKCVFTQREIGIDVPDFAMGLRQALRMDPDVILIGEMRDVETIQIAIKAAETGHLVLSTLHTTGAVHTIQRIIGHFPQREHDIVREQLSLNLKASVTQRLVRTRDGKGRIAAQEIMVVTTTVAKLIRDNRVTDIFPVILSGQEGMCSFDQSLAELVRQKVINFEEGQKFCEDFYAYRRAISGIASSGDAGGIIA
jgi:twitching motility protein PilT